MISHNRNFTPYVANNSDLTGIPQLTDGEIAILDAERRGTKGWQVANSRLQEIKLLIRRAHHTAVRCQPNQEDG